MSLRSIAPVAFALAACGGGDGLSRADCDAVLAHLVVLESAGGESWGPMCKYHASCDGSDAPRWAAACPRAISRDEATCLQRATSLPAADGCVLRDELDARIQAGDRGGGGFPGRAVADDTSGGALGELVALRDDACRCHDTACASTMLDRYAEQARRYNDVDDRHLRDRAMGLIEAAAKCLVAANTPPDAGPPPYRDPWQPDAGVAVLPGSTGLPHCDQYIAALEAYAACSAIPEDARASIRETVEYVRKSWVDLASMPDSVRAATDDSCAQSIDGIRSAITSLGCAVP